MRILALLILACATALASAPAHADGAPLWRAEKNEAVINLFGAMPAADGDDWRSPALDAALSEAAILIFETEMDAATAQTTTMNAVMTQGFLAPGGSLADDLDPDREDALRNAATSAGMPYERIATMRPWHAFLALDVGFLSRRGFKPGAGPASILLREARADEKELRFLETISEQLATFTNLAPAAETALLVALLDDWSAREERFADVTRDWTAGRAEALDPALNASMREGAPAAFRAIRAARNETWADRLVEIARQEAVGDIFVVVGAAHLVGPSSLRDALAARGYRLSRVHPPTDEPR